MCSPPSPLQDYVLDEARKRSIRVLLVLSDYFSDDAGGPLQYLE